ncbi:MAG: PBP1A family penicillin-binding protein [Acidobacteria bacterium]|nr:PBP1A family penicillin-binding protein [Acidobacteriota bacterium]
MRVLLKNRWWSKSPLRPLWAGLLCLAAVTLIGGASAFTYYYVRYSRVIEQRLQGPVFPPASQVYAAPEKLRVGQAISQQELIFYLRQAGFSEVRDNPKGWYTTVPHGVRIVPGKDSYFAPEAAEIGFSENRITSIVSLGDHFARNEYELEPLLITNLFDRSREKRRLVSFADLPSNLINAVLAIEDRRFFQHSGVDYLRILKAAYVDIRSGSARQGASTLTMQLARSLFLTRERTIKRKLAETLVAFQLERRLSKQQIFEYYCNKIYMGQRGSFSISGVGEAAQAYFNKDVRNLSLPEAAFLAGLIQGPNLYSPYRNPELAEKRRNQVLEAMADIETITPEEKEEALRTPLQVAPRYGIASEAPYFVDMIKDQLLDKYTEEELASQSYRIYTTLDLKLQKSAAEAVQVGISEVEERLKAMRRPRRANAAAAPSEQPPVEVVLIAMDPRSGAVKALVGGREYGRSQLNRALARRSPGSVFKPFVYAAALASGMYDAVGPRWTAASKINDEPTTFVFDGGAYQPANFGNQYYGAVTLRYALMRSLNVSTVKVAQMVGYENVVALARRAGMNLRIQPTPAVALGAYEVKPLEIAGAYTVFANGGVRMDPYSIAQVLDRDGLVLDRAQPRPTRVLDPRVAFLITNIMEDVINRGTGAGVRARGFKAPAAGKTGTSYDGWFAGYTSNLLCIVWVGYDSDRELPLTGAASALPIWTEFMKRAVALPQYSNVRPTVPPPGIVKVEIDPETNELATPHCSNVVSEFFIEGTQPLEYCHRHFLQELPRSAPSIPSIAGLPPPKALEPVVVKTAPPVAQVAPPPPPPATNGAAPEEVKPKKKGFFGRIFGIFKGGSDEEESPRQ